MDTKLTNNDIIGTQCNDKSDVYISTSGNEVRRGKSVGLGFFSSLSLFIGLVIGSGVFASTGEVYAKMGTFYGSMIIWSAAGVLSLMGSFIYAELGSSIPEAGGDHVYLYRGLGSLASFLFSWVGWLTRPTLVATLSLTLAKFAYSLFAGQRSDDVPNSEHVVVGMSSGAIVIITIYCCLSKHSSKWVQNVLAVIKVGSLLVFGITGFYYLGLSGGKLKADTLSPKQLTIEREEAGLPSDPFKFGEGAISLSHLCTALYLALWGFDGWSNLNLVALEISNPSRDLPRVMILGVSLTTCFYLIMNLAYFTVLTPSQYTGVETISKFAVEAYGESGRLIALIVVVLSVFGALNSAIFCNTEVCFAAAADRFAPKIFAYIYPKSETPVFSLVFQSALALILTWIFGVNYSALINFYSIPIWVIYAGSGVALIRLRITEPNLRRPFKTSVVLTYIYVIVSFFMIIFSFVDAKYEATFAVCFLLLGIPVWYTFVYRGYRFVKVPGSGITFRGGEAKTTNKKFKMNLTTLPTRD